MSTNEGVNFIMEEFPNLKKEVEDSLKNIDFYNFSELLNKLTDKVSLMNAIFLPFFLHSIRDFISIKLFSVG